MALGFQRQGIFGRRNPLEPMAPQVMPQPDAMPIGVKEMTKKPGFFQKGGFGQYALAALSDFGARLNDRDQNMLGSMMAFNQKKQMEAEEARLKALEPIKLGNSIIRPDGKGGYTQVYSEPQQPNNDTVADYNFWKQTLPPEQFQKWLQNKIDPPQYRQGGDGRFYRIDIADGPLPTFTDDDWNKGQPLGGSVGDGAGGFRR